MNLELSRRDVAVVVAFVLASVALLGYVLSRLGTLPLPASGEHSVQAVVANAQGLPTQADVLVHGVKVGTVSDVVPRGARTLVTLTLDGAAPALRRDAAVRIGFKTPLGEPFVDLDPGHAASRLRTAALLPARPTVAIDDALAFLDRRGRADLRATLIPLGAGAASHATAQEVSGTLAELSAATTEGGRLAAELRAQRSDLSTTIADGRVILDVLAGRAAALRGLLTGAHTAFGAVATQRTALGATIDRLGPLLRSSASTLRGAEPLVARATPLARTLGTAAPEITAALQQLPPVTELATRVLAQAPAIRASVLPAVSALGRLAAPGSRALSLLGPVLADLVPVARYLGPRGRTIAAWFANTAALGSHGDAKGDWARFFVMFDRATLLGHRSGAPQGNAYTAPGDAAHNTSYRPGGYSRLVPYSPALQNR